MIYKGKPTPIAVKEISSVWKETSSPDGTSFLNLYKQGLLPRSIYGKGDNLILI